MLAIYNSAAERNKNAQVLPAPSKLCEFVAEAGVAQLTSGYDEIARSLFTEELSVVGNYEVGEMIGKGNSNFRGYRAKLIATRIVWESVYRTPYYDKNKGPKL
jgi:hypothetical protein